jgi:hypothetical protein
MKDIKTYITEKIVAHKKGSFFSLSWRSEHKPAAAHKGTQLVKMTVATVRFGVEYANLGTVREGIESGQRGPVQPLAWGQWADYPYVIEHKGGRYLRVYPCPNNLAKISYFVDGKQVGKAEFAAYMAPSAAKALDEERLCFNIKVENIIF